MSINSRAMRIALVTRTDDKYIYIWSTSLGINELKYPIKSIRDIEAGDFVRYHQSEDGRGVQNERDICRETTIQMPVIKGITRRNHFGVKTNLVFPPPTYLPYKKYVESADLCQLMAYSPDFGQVVSFFKTEFKSNVVYEGYVTRIPKAKDEIIGIVHTIFCLIISDKTSIIEVEDINVINDVFKDLPWENNPSISGYTDVDEDFKSESEEDVTGLGGFSQKTSNNSSNKNYYNTQSSNDDNLNNRNDNLIINLDDSQSSLHKQTSTNSFTNNCFNNDFKNESRNRVDQNIVEDEMYARKLQQQEYESAKKNNYNEVQSTQDGFGLIVRIEPRYSIIWSSYDYYVCISEDNSARNMPLGTWVNYKCINDFLKVENGAIKKTAYAVEEIKPKRLSLKFQNTVKCQAFVRLIPETCNEYFVLTNDDVLGYVLCSRDPYLLKRLKNEEEVEVWTVFMESYQKPSKWIAIAVNTGNNDWKKLEKLTDRVEEIANQAFTRKTIVEDYCLGKQPLVNLSEPKYCLPEHWTGPKHITSTKIRDVLGIVILNDTERTFSILHTCFGLAKFNNFVILGTWMRITIEEVSLNQNYFPIALETTNKYFIIEKGDKIFPPMSTRVVDYKDEEKILLCGKVIYEQKYLENEFLGIVIDSKNLIEYDYNSLSSSKNFLVELAFIKRSNSKKYFWNVVKFHGSYMKNINHVPLQMSVYPEKLGRTCDDPHTILINSQYQSNIFPSDKYTDNDRKSVNNNINLEWQRYDELTNHNDNTVDRINLQENFKSSSRDSLVRSSQDINELEDLKKTSAAHWLFSNENKTTIIDELNRYTPNVNGNKWRGVCLVVRKCETFALAYSRKFRIILIKADAFKSLSEFNELCEPAKWLEGTILRVLRRDFEEDLRFKFILSPIYKPVDENVMPTRILGDFVQVHIFCKFDNETVTRVTEEPTKFVVKTDLGKVLISESLYKKNEFHDKSLALWVTHISEKHDCYWKFVLKDLLMNYDLYCPKENEEELLNINDDCLQICWNKENQKKIIDDDLLLFRNNYEIENKQQNIQSLMSDFDPFGLDKFTFNKEESEMATNGKTKPLFLLSQLAAEELEANKRLKQNKIISEIDSLSSNIDK